jgi:hypothetical protein
VYNIKNPFSMTASDMPEWAIPTQSSRAQGVGDLEAAYFDPSRTFATGQRFSLICADRPAVFFGKTTL